MHIQDIFIQLFDYLSIYFSQLNKLKAKHLFKLLLAQHTDKQTDRQTEEGLPVSPFSPRGPWGPAGPGGHLHLLRFFPFCLLLFFFSLKKNQITFISHIYSRGPLSSVRFIQRVPDPRVLFINHARSYFHLHFSYILQFC